MGEYDDMFGEIAVNQANKKRLEKDIASGQKSLFFDYDARNNENTEGMKKAAVEKANKEEAVKEAQEKAKARAAENEEFKDKRTPKSKMIAESYLKEMKELTAPKSRGAGGAGVGDVGIKGIGKKSKLDFAKGGKVKSASARADGCCIRGKTRA